MASILKHLRSSTADKRPTASGLADGQIAINTASGTPAMFFKDSAGNVVKVGPVHVGAGAPNASPAGSAGNSTGELWVNNSLTTPGLNYYTGSAFVNLTPSGTTSTVGLVELATNAETQAGSDAVRAVTSAGLQSKVSDSTSTTSSTTIASSTAVKSAYDLANAALPKSGGTLTGELLISPSGSLVFEGSSDDSFETTLAVTNPTADRTITFPNVTGTVITTGDTGTVTSTMIADGTIVNADINASAAIAPSKLGSGALPSGVTVASANIVDGTIVNADVNASAAIAGTKISPDFGGQNVVTTGNVTGAALIPSSSVVPTNGVYLPSANNVAISTDGAERARIDSSGRLLVGTSSAYTIGSSSSWAIQAATVGISAIRPTNDTNPATLTLAKTRSTSLGSFAIVQNNDNIGIVDFAADDGTDYATSAARIICQVDGISGANDMPGRLVFSTTADGSASPTERMRIDRNGKIIGSTGGLEITRNIDGDGNIGSFTSSSATTANQFGLFVRLTGDPNNTGQYFLACYGGEANQRATIRSNGGLANYQSNNVDLSDERTKRDIASAPSTWDCVQSWNVVNYNYLDDAQNESARIGVIAQQVQQHCPEVVIPYQEAEDAVLDGDGNVVTPAKEERLGVREQQMMWMAIKALQEAMERIEVLEQRLTDAGIA